jgi:hypothetical protein
MQEVFAVEEHVRHEVSQGVQTFIKTTVSGK